MHSSITFSYQLCDFLLPVLCILQWSILTWIPVEETGCNAGGVFAEKVFQEKSPNGRLNYIPDQGPRKTPSRWDLDYERGSLMTTGLENFLSSESITPSGM